MPNHVINEILLHGVKLDDCRKHIFNAEGRISFAVLLPLPLNFWAGSVGREHENAFPGTHLDAARQTWGTKWDAYGGPTAEDTEAGTLIRFQTAWNHPRGWTCAVFNTLKCEITASWFDEGALSAFVERYDPEPASFCIGESWKQEEFAEGTSEHRRLHKLLFGVEAFEDEVDDTSEAKGCAE